ncbi:MAG: hypothetical protein ACRDJH_24945 [Thermomicrobiales bacterium]
MTGGVVRRIGVSALPHLVLAAALCATLAPWSVTAQSAQDDVVVLIDERFDNPAAGEFTESENDDTRLVYERGEYVMEGIGQQFSGGFGVQVYDVVADGTIAVDVRLRGPVEDRLVFVGCRNIGSNAALGYSLMLDLAHGDVVLWAEIDPDDGADVQLTDYVAHDAIRPGIRTNRLELSCIGSTITARVNGVEVVSVTDDRYQRGHFNFGVGAFSSSPGPVEGVFDNLLVTMAPSPDPAARQDVLEFDQLRADAQEQSSLFGPAEGEVRHNEEALVGNQYAEVEVRDFYARTTFVNPYDVDEQRWSVGIAFRDTGSDEHLRFILRSTGRWFLGDADTWPMLASGLAAGMATAAGEENTLEVAMVEETGYLALNGEYVATFDASVVMASGDIWIGAGLFQGDNVLDDRTAFHGFEVWGLGDDTAEAAVGQPRLPGPRDADDTDGSTDEQTAANAVTVELHDMDQSGRSGQATLTAEGDGTKVALRVRDVPGLTLVVLQEGPCTVLDEQSGFALQPLNEAGVSVTIIDAALDALLADTHAIVVYDYDAATGIATLPIACGEVVAP